MQELLGRIWIQLKYTAQDTHKLSLIFYRTFQMTGGVLKRPKNTEFWKIKVLSYKISYPDSPNVKNHFFFLTSSISTQVPLSSTNPAKQGHSKPPSVFVHREFSPQLSEPLAHSSMSEHVTPSPWNPLSHMQLFQSSKFIHFDLQKFKGQKEDFCGCHLF